MQMNLNKLGIPNVTVSKTASVKCGITGTHIDVSVNGEHEDEHMHDHHHDHHHHHHHTGMHEIEHIIEHFDIPEKVRTDILAVYHLIAEAESHAHGCEIEQIHFHEVGQMDAVADITGVCMLIHELGIDKIIASPIHVGCGQVQCAHGILPIPAPATAYILKDIPIEEVNRDKKGIRVKALRENGFTNYADIFTASKYQIASVRGISEDGAYRIKKIVSEAADTAEIGRYRSQDNKTETEC